MEALFNHLPSIISALAGLAGAGVFAGLAKLWRTWKKQQRKDEKQEHRLDEEETAAQSDRISLLQKRMTTLEDKFEEERKSRVEAEIRNKQLQATVSALEVKIDTLIEMIRDLRDKAGMDELTEEEEERLRSTPDYTDLNSDTQRNAEAE